MTIEFITGEEALEMLLPKSWDGWTVQGIRVDHNRKVVEPADYDSFLALRGEFPNDDALRQRIADEIWSRTQLEMEDCTDVAWGVMCIVAPYIKAGMKSDV
jgi:hypothetical protein